jgi:uncharacterized membrane-anchored protein
MDKPSASTFASAGIGVPVATVLSWIVNTFTGVDVPGPVEAALGAIVSTIIGYIFLGGKASDVE